MKNLQDFRSFGGKLLRLTFEKRHRISFFFLFAMKESKKKKTNKKLREVSHKFHPKTLQERSNSHSPEDTLLN